MRTPVALTCLVLLGVCLTSPLPAQCPEGGYPLAVTSADSSSINRTYLDAFARAAAYRWQVPSRERPLYVNWQRVRRRTLPPEPRWADDWQPSLQHRAELVITVFRNGRVRAAEPSPLSGDRLFDRSLRTVATDPMPAAPSVPPFPAEVTGDSLRLRLYFGYDSVPAPHGVVRFAASQTPVRLASAGVTFSVPRTSGSPTPTARYIVMKYDVSETGEIVPGSFETLDSSDRDFEIAVRDNLMRQRFQPATQNCRPITMTVVQRAGT